MNKYLKNSMVVEWLQGKNFPSHGVSIIWIGSLQTLPWLGCDLSWQVGNGENILLGIDTIVGASHPGTLPSGLLNFLDDMEINTLAHAHNTLAGSPHYWYSSEDLCITGSWKSGWDSLTKALDLGGIRLHTRADSLIWAFNKQKGSVTANLVYDSIVLSSNPPVGCILFDLIWNGTIPRKICCFIWLALSNKVLTWDNLQKRGWTKPGICFLCYANEENIRHLFLNCPIWKNVLNLLCDQFHITPIVHNHNLRHFLVSWTDRFLEHSVGCYLPFFIMWIIWKARNLCIFEGRKVSILSIIQQTGYLTQLYGPLVKKRKKSSC